MSTPLPEIRPRRWQSEALPLALASLAEGRRGVVVATMGAGKSIFIASILRHLLAEEDGGAVVVTTPTVKLVEQLCATFCHYLGRRMVGAFYGKRKDVKARVIVCCNPSAGALAEALAVAQRPVAAWIADEAHRTEAEQLKAAAEAFAARSALAVTATPFRSADKERLSLWDEVLYKYEPAEALRDGVIVPWRRVAWQGPATSVDDAVIEMMRQAELVGPGIVNASNCADADAYAGRLCDEGFPAAPIHSGISPTEQAELLRQLLAGDLRCLVHVNMLSEGVDIPELRWLVLRRKVDARVRFAQEVGRVLRACPGKSEALILDPNDLFGSYSLTYEASLGWPEGEDEMPDPDRATPTARAEREIRTRWATCLDPASVWARALYLAAEADGVAAPSEVRAGSWRAKAPTAGSLRFLAGLEPRARKLPAEHAAFFRSVHVERAYPNQGMVSDLCDLLRSLDRPWAPSQPVEVPGAAALDLAKAAAYGDGLLYAAGVYDAASGLLAIVILRGRTVLHCECRETKDDTTFTAVQILAAKMAARKASIEDKVYSCDAHAVALLMGRRRPRNDIEARTLAVTTPWETEYVHVERSEAQSQAWAVLSKHQRRGTARAA